VEPFPLTVMAGLVVAYGLVSEWLADRSISGPLVFTLFGVALGPVGFDLVGDSFEANAIELLAEATLVVLLFADATRINLAALRRQVALPARLLGIGLPLTILAGTLLAWLLLGDEMRFWEAALLAAVLTPTDAALGQAVVSDTRVPIKVRQALNVESGLNDGLMVPVITVLVAVAGVDAGLDGPGDWLAFAAAQVGFGLVVGLAVGGLGGRLLDGAAKRGWVEGAMRQLITLALAVGAYGAATWLDGNGFLAAFVAGMTFGAVTSDDCEDAADFTEDEGQLLTLLTFAFFGALLLGPRLETLTVEVAVYAVAALTVMRMVPVAVAMVGAGLAWPTVSYLAWFGPRGLASIVFAVVVVEELETPGTELLLDVVVWTVAASIVAHGLSAVPAAGRYAAWYEGMTADADHDMMESESVDEMRTRK
jgi:NhaP-type Na+/H+ or K+/H+ antiporter